MDAKHTASMVETVDTSYLESLIGYNARRTALVAIEKFLQQLSSYDLRPVPFSILSLILHNPGITSRQICVALGLQAPNLVTVINALEKKGTLYRRPHPQDGRAIGLHLTSDGHNMMQKAEHVVSQLEGEILSKLKPKERDMLLSLLQKIYG